MYSKTIYGLFSKETSWTCEMFRHAVMIMSWFVVMLTEELPDVNGDSAKRFL